MRVARALRPATASRLTRTTSTCSMPGRRILAARRARRPGGPSLLARRRSWTRPAGRRRPGPAGRYATRIARAARRRAQRQGLLPDGQPEGARLVLDAAAARRVEDPPVAGRGDEDARARGPGPRPSPSPGLPRRGPRAAAWRRGAGPARRAGGGRPTCARPGRRAASPAPGPAAGAAAPGRSPPAPGAPGRAGSAARSVPAQPLRQDVVPRRVEPERRRAAAQAVEVRREVDRHPLVHEERRQDAVGGLGALAVGERVRRGGPRRGAGPGARRPAPSRPPPAAAAP